MKHKEIDAERSYARSETVAKLRRIADALEAGKSFRIQVDGYRVRVPADVTLEVELQREGDGDGEVEIEIKWKRDEK